MAVGGFAQVADERSNETEDRGSCQKKHSMNWEQYGNTVERRVRARQPYTHVRSLSHSFGATQSTVHTFYSIAHVYGEYERMYAIIIKTQWQKFNAVNVHSMVT